MKLCWKSWLRSINPTLHVKAADADKFGTTCGSASGETANWFYGWPLPEHRFWHRQNGILCPSLIGATLAMRRWNVHDEQRQGNSSLLSADNAVLKSYCCWACDVSLMKTARCKLRDKFDFRNIEVFWRFIACSETANETMSCKLKHNLGEEETRMLLALMLIDFNSLIVHRIALLCYVLLLCFVKMHGVRIFILLAFCWKHRWFPMTMLVSYCVFLGTWF